MKEYIYPSRVICENTGINTANLLKIQPMQIGLAERFTTRFDDMMHSRDKEAMRVKALIESTESRRFARNMSNAA